MTDSLLEVADALDSLGLHKEADALDRILRKRADALAYREKPFLARLAKILMALKKYKSGDVISEDLTFPSTGVRLMGLSRAAAIEEVQKHLKMFVDQYLLPNLDEKYKGGKLEMSYRKFITEVINLSQMMQGIFSTRSEQQSIREGLGAVEQVKKMVGHLMVYARTKAQLGKPVEPEVEASLKDAIHVLGGIETGVKQLNEDIVKKGIEQLLSIFPRKIDSDSPLFQLLVDAYREEVIPFVRQNVVDEEARQRLDIAQEAELNEAESQYKKFNAELLKKRDLERHAEELETRAKKLEAEAAKYDFPTQMIPTYKQWEAEMKKEPGTFLPPVKVSHYKNKFRRYEVIAGDLSNLEKWLDRYKSRTDINQITSFSNFLSKMGNSQAAQKAFEIIDMNIADLKDEVERDIQATDNARVAVERELWPLRKLWSDTKNQVVWDLWHEQYIIKMVQVLNYILAPETRGEETSAQAFSKVLSKLSELLNYRI